MTREPRIFAEIDAVRRAVRNTQREGRRVGLVPTMGALHEGHRSLIRASQDRCEVTAVSIFVNPTQFAPGEDFAAYPKTFDADIDACRSEGANIVFAPAVETMYPAGAMTAIYVAKLTEGLCGPHRPGHFDGVATIVAKLFQILPADVAFFGEKDYQQLKVIQRMVRDLDIPMEIVACPTIREPDGLAMSSRNVYLANDDRKKAASLSRALFDAAERIAKGERNAAVITDEIRRFVLGAAPTASTNITIDYVDIVDAESLEVLTAIDRRARICAAIRIGPTRLIDNVPIDFANDSRNR